MPPSNSARSIGSHLKLIVLKCWGWARVLTRPVRFRGAYASYAEALQNVRVGVLAGYDHDGVSRVHEEKMERVRPWDYPVLYWLYRLGPELTRLVDAGGHTGVLYRAFAPHLELDRVDWIVFDLPSMVKAGREKKRPEDRTLSFVDRIEDAPPADVLLVSGLLQYLDGTLTELVGSLQAPPRYIVLNKVATRDGMPVVTLESLGIAQVPYQIRDQREVPAELAALGYEIIDEWVIPSHAHEIPTYPELGRSTSRGYVARRLAQSEPAAPA